MDQTTWTVANALKVTFFGNSGVVEPPRCLITGFSVAFGLAVISPAEAAKSFSFWDSAEAVDLEPEPEPLPVAAAADDC